MELKDKVVVITGGSKGIGLGLAKAFIKEGSKVAICALDEEELNKIAKNIGALDIKADVRIEKDMQNLANKTIKEYGGLDIWINNAGIWIEGAPEDMDMNKVKDMFDINLIGSINGTRVALSHMKNKNHGTIINVMSKVALGVRPGLSMYVATKYGLNGFTKTVREEYKDTKILFLSVFPGGVRTELYRERPEKPANYDNFMDPMDVATQVIDNLKKPDPLTELVILGKGEKILQEHAK